MLVQWNERTSKIKTTIPAMTFTAEQVYYQMRFGTQAFKRSKQNLFMYLHCGFFSPSISTLKALNIKSRRN